MDANYINSKPPQPDQVLNKKTILIVLLIITLILTVAFNTRILGGKKAKEAVAEDKGKPSFALNRLPSTYSELPKPAQEKVKLDTAKTPSELEKELERLRLERLKKANEARVSKLSFDGLDISSKNESEPMSSPQETFSNQALSNPRDDANRQDDKKNFLEAQRKNGTILTQPLISPLSKYQLMAGTVVPGVLITGLNSDLPGEIQGQVSQNVFDTVSGNYLLIPQGTKVLGKYDSRISYGQERLLIVWTRLIMPNGKSITLEGMPGVDMSGYAGLSDQVNHHFLRLLTGVLFSSVLSAGAQMAEGSTYETTDPRFSQLAAQGAAKNINDVGQEVTRRNLDIQPTLEIRPGFRFNILTNKDIILEPYTG